MVRRWLGIAFRGESRSEQRLRRPLVLDPCEARRAVPDVRKARRVGNTGSSIPIAAHPGSLDNGGDEFLFRTHATIHGPPRPDADSLRVDLRRLRRSRSVRRACAVDGGRGAGGRTFRRRACARRRRGASVHADRWIRHEHRRRRCGEPGRGSSRRWCRAGAAPALLRATRSERRPDRARAIPSRANVCGQCRRSGAIAVAIRRSRTSRNRGATRRARVRFCPGVRRSTRLNRRAVGRAL